MDENKETEKPFKVEVVKNSKGYNWTVRVYGDDVDAIKTQLENLEAWLKDKYGVEI